MRHGLTDRIERGLLSIAALFLLLFATSLTLAPAVRQRSWDVELRWAHWLGLLIWAGVVLVSHLQARRRLPGRDAYLLPLAAVLSGWGLLSIWRLTPSIGLRQSVWLLVCGLVFVVGLRLSRDLDFLRRFKYVWLTGGLLLTGLTLIFGTNPLGFGPRLWLGCCGLYFQPSEPLKLLLVVYLAAYLAGQDPYYLTKRRRYLLPLLAPTLIMTGLTMALLLVQRDLGTASIFIFLYIAVVFVATGDWRFLAFGGLTLILAGVAGYALFDVVRLRVDAWLNPWLDPSGRSFQIVQSLLAVASGGLVGRGPGLGNPTLVPISHSDFIFAAISEEQGLSGSIALLVMLAILAWRGFRIALLARDNFQRYLASGLSAYLAGQSILIIGGNLRLLPLTGVTLPFVSYGGSSLLTSFISVLLLELISQRDEDSRPILQIDARPYLGLVAILLAGLGSAALVSGWWAIYRGPDLLTRSDNARRAIAERSVLRGELLDRNGTVLSTSSGEPGAYTRQILYPPLSPVIGYSNPMYGLAALEDGLDPYLRGLRGNPGLSILWNQLLYGQPPPGLDIRLSLNLEIQRAADEALGLHNGAVVLIDARRGEILVMASHPTYDANLLEQTWESLVNDPFTPLLNRAAQGRYPIGDLAAFLFPLGYQDPGLDLTNKLYLPATGLPEDGEVPRLSPLQVSLSAAALSASGIRPAPILAMAVNTPAAGWVFLPAQSSPSPEYDENAAFEITRDLLTENQMFWGQVSQVADQSETFVTWYVGGTPPTWSGTPLAIAVLLEEDNRELAQQLGQDLLLLAMQP